MKKILAVILTVAMLFMLCMTTVIADSGMGDSSADVFIKVDEDVVIHQYSVDVEFGDMHFIYGASATWDSELHDYIFSDEAAWMPESQNSDRILLRNHSDSPVTYETDRLINAPSRQPQLLNRLCRSLFPVLPKFSQKISFPLQKLS